MGGDSAGINSSWREHVLSESLRKMLEGCDVVKGFNVFVDGGCSTTGGGGHANNGESGNNISGSNNKHAKKLASILSSSSGGGFHAGLAASLLEELGEECRSAGRWAVMADPLSSLANDDDVINGNGNHNALGGGSSSGAAQKQERHESKRCKRFNCDYALTCWNWCVAPGRRKMAVAATAIGAMEKASAKLCLSVGLMSSNR